MSEIQTVWKRDATQLSEIQNSFGFQTFTVYICIKWSRLVKYMQILLSLGFQIVSEIGNVGEWDTTELSEIQISSDFRHSLYCKAT